MSREEWQRVSDLLRQAAQESVRPLSHRIWQRVGQRYDVPPWWMLPLTIVRHQPFRPVAFALIDIPGTLGSNVHEYGGVRGAVLVAVGLVWSIPVMLIANAAMRRRPGWHTAIFLIALGLLEAVVAVRGNLRDAWVSGSRSVGWQLSQMVAVVVVVLVTSGFGAWRNRDAAQLANLQAVVEVESEATRERTAQIAMLTRETAQYLHGSLQTRLVGSVDPRRGGSEGRPVEWLLCIRNRHGRERRGFLRRRSRRWTRGRGSHLQRHPAWPRIAHRGQRDA